MHTKNRPRIQPGFSEHDPYLTWLGGGGVLRSPPQVFPKLSENASSYQAETFLL